MHTVARVGSILLLTCGAGFAQENSDPITLTVWDAFTGPAEASATAIYDRFMENNPNVTIKRETYTYEQLRTTSWLAMRSDQAPDLLYIDVAPAREMAAEDLLLPLDQYVEKYGWDKRIYESGLEWGNFDGTLYGVGIEYEFVGVFYNETLMEQEGLDLPDTLDELLDFCRAASEKGYVPLAHSQNPGWQTMFSFGLPLTHVLGVEGVKNLIFNREGRFDDPEVVRAIKVFHEEMRDAGCFVSEGVNALDFQGAIELFVTGEALMFPTGTWAVGRIDDLKSPEHVIKMMPFVSIPGTEAERAYTTGMGSLFTIAASSKNPDVAAELLDAIYSEESIASWIENGFVPPTPPQGDLSALSELKQFVLSVLEDAGTGEGDLELGINMDLFMSEVFINTLSSGAQQVTAGTKTPQQLADELQAVWEEK